MSQQDKDRFASFAHAQVALTNEIYDYLDKPNLLLFCPTRKILSSSLHSHPFVVFFCRIL